MTKVSIKQVMLGVLSLSLIATDAFGNMLPPVPVSQTNIRVRVAASGPVPMPMQVPYGPQPMGQHGMYQQQTNVRVAIRAQGGGQCGQPGCGQRRQCGAKAIARLAFVAVVACRAVAVVVDSTLTSASTFVVGAVAVAASDVEVVAR